MSERLIRWLGIVVLIVGTAGMIGLLLAALG
jgi:hypothetical protein